VTPLYEHPYLLTYLLISLLNYHIQWQHIDQKKNFWRTLTRLTHCHHERCIIRELLAPLLVRSWILSRSCHPKSSWLSDQNLLMFPVNTYEKTMLYHFKLTATLEFLYALSSGRPTLSMHTMIAYHPVFITLTAHSLSSSTYLYWITRNVQRASTLHYQPLIKITSINKPTGSDPNSSQSFSLFFLFSKLHQSGDAHWRRI